MAWRSATPHGRSCSSRPARSTRWPASPAPPTTTFVFDIDAGFGEVLAGSAAAVQDPSRRRDRDWTGDATRCGRRGARRRPNRRRLAEDGCGDRAGRDHPCGHRRDGRGGELHQGLLSRARTRRTDGQPGRRVAAVVAGAHDRSRRRRRAAPGDPVVDASGATIGTVTSVGSTQALATIKRGHAVGAAPASRPTVPTWSVPESRHPARRERGHGGRVPTATTGWRGRQHQRVADRGHVGVVAQVRQLG